MEIVEDSGFDSDHKTSALAPMAEESEQNKITEVCCVIVYHVIFSLLNELCFICLILLSFINYHFNGSKVYPWLNWA